MLGEFAAAGGTVLGSTVSIVGSTVAGSVTGNVASGVLNGPMLYLAQASLQNSPHLVPSAEVLIGSYYRGDLSQQSMRYWLTLHGVPSPDADVSWARRKSIWDIAIEEMKPVLPIERVRQQFVGGFITEQERDRYIQRLGLARNDDWQKFFYVQAPVTPEQSLVLLNRSKIDYPTHLKNLARAGIDREEDQRDYQYLRYWFPGPSDVINWAIKDVWQQSIVDRFQYDAEFPPLFQFFMDRQGAGWKPSDLGYAVNPQFDVTLPRNFWRAHWQVISPSQAMDAVHRLRPRSIASDQSRTEGVPAFTRDDFNLILKTADYPPIMREWLFGLSFTPLTRVDIRRFSRLLPWTKTEIEARYMDLGYSPQDAVVQAEFTIAERHAMETGRDRARIETVIRQLYEECVYSPGEAAAALKAARLKTPQQQADFAALGTQQQQAEGLADPAISFLLGSLDAKKKLNLARKTKSAVRSAFIRREISLQIAQQLLSQAGITGNCATELLQLWTLEMSIRGKQATASQILRWFVRGAITGQEVALRLSLMGYSNRDITAMLAVAGQDISLAVARQRKQLATDERGRLQAIRTELRLLRSQRKEAIADLNASATKAQIVKFYSSGLVSRKEALAALIQRGVFPRDAELFLEDIDNAKSKANDKIQSGSSQNGQASESGNQGTTGSSP